MINDARRIERAIRELAGRQHGLVTRSQLLHAGLSRDSQRWRVRTGKLEPVHRGIYRVGPLVGARAREMAAVLACGRGAVISHRSAGILWRLWPDRGVGDRVDVTLANGDRGRRPGIRAHRVRALPADEVTELDGVPITTPSRTIVDLSSEATPRELEQAVARAERQGLVAEAGLLALLERYSTRPGVPLLRALLDAETGPALTRSKAEERCRALVERAGLPKPVLNTDIEGREVDFLWREHRLVVDVDGFAFHSSRRRFEGDRSRDAMLAARGYRVMRVTWRQITREPEAVVARLAAALAEAALQQRSRRELAARRGRGAE